MALFLSESYHTTTASIPLEEAMVGLLEATMALSDLNESVLQADFILHERHNQMIQTQGLTESTQMLIEEQQAGLFARVWASLKAGFETAKKKVVEVFKAIGGKFRELWTKITSKKPQAPAPAGEAPKAATSIKVNVHKYELAAKALDGLSEIQKVLNTGTADIINTVVGRAQAVTEVENEIKAAVKTWKDQVEAGKKAEDKTGALIDLASTSGVSKIGEGAAKVEAMAKEAEVAIGKMQQHAEKEAAAAKSGYDNHDKQAKQDKKDSKKLLSDEEKATIANRKSKGEHEDDHKLAQATIKGCKVLISGYSQLAGLAAQVFSMAGSAVHV